MKNDCSQHTRVRCIAMQPHNNIQYIGDRAKEQHIKQCRFNWVNYTNHSYVIGAVNVNLNFTISGDFMYTNVLHLFARCFSMTAPKIDAHIHHIQFVPDPNAI